MNKRWVQLGIVGKAHGLNGAFFISHRDEVLPSQVKELRIGATPESAPRFHVQASRMQGERPILQTKEIQNRETAEGYLLQPIWCERQSLTVDEQAEYMWVDLIGKLVVDASGVVVGHVKEVGNFGASDVVRLFHEDRGSLEIPFVKNYFDMGFRSEDSELRLLVDISCFDEAWSPL